MTLRAICLILSIFTANGMISTTWAAPACPTARSGFDSPNPVAYLGYSQARHLLHEAGADYYIAQYAYNGKHQQGFVAVHDVEDHEPVIDARLRHYQSGEIWGIQYSEAMIAHYRDFLIPCLETLAPEVATITSPYIISHYAKSDTLKISAKRKAAAPKDFIVVPALLSTFFTTQKGFSSEKFPPMPKYIGRGESVARLGENQALTVKEAMAARAKIDKTWVQQQRLAGMAQEERDEAILKIKRAEDNAKIGAAAEKGLVARDRYYWKKFTYAAQLEGILNGTLRTNNRLFPHLYIGYVNYFSAVCAQTLPAGARMSTALPRGAVDYVWYTSMAGDPGGVYRVHPKHWQSYSRNWASIDGKNALSTHVRAQKFLGDIRADMQLMMREETCESGFMRQFDENIARLANGTVTLQNDGKVHAFVVPQTPLASLGAQSSIRRPAKKPKPTLLFACQIHNEKRELYQDPRWCQCVSDKFSKVLTHEELNRYANDYNAFLRAMTAKPKSSAPSEWRLMNQANACRTCNENDYRDNCLDSSDRSISRRTYANILNQLDTGRFSAIPVDALFQNFYVDYIDTYSDNCGQYIYKGKIYTVTEEGKRTPEKIVYLEEKYVDQYFNYDTRGGLATAMTLMTEVFDVRLKGELPFKVGGLFTANFISAKRELSNHFSPGCKSPIVRRVYENLYRRAHGKNPIVTTRN